MTAARDREPRQAPGPSSARATRAVYQLLVSIARSDSTITSAERAILDRYRSALEIQSEIVSFRETDAPPEIDLSVIPQEEGVQVLRMMFRVAYADGSCNQMEMALLERIASAMGLSRVQFAGVRVSIERRVRHRKRTRRFTVAAGVVVIASVILAVVLWRPDRTTLNEETEARLDETTRVVQNLEQRIGQVGVERAEQDAELIRQTSARLDLLEQELRSRVDELQQPVATPPAGDAVARLTRELGDLKQQLAELEARQVAFKEIEKRYAGSVLLLLTRYDLTSASRREEKAGFGTGFFVTPGGLIVTNKHVVQPWKFDASAVRLLESGYTLDQDSIRLTAWVGGALISDPATEPFEGLDSDRRTLRLVAIPQDRMAQRPEMLPDGSVYVGRLHEQNDADLALLGATVERPVTALPLLLDGTGVEKLDPVMVLGFPSGPGILESGRAESSPSRGDVRKVEDTIYISAPIVPGNSGGPVIDQQGRVIALATRTAAGEATLGSCIQSSHILPLLPAATELVSEAARLIDGGHVDDGRMLLDLAEARDPSAADRSRIQKLRGR